MISHPPNKTEVKKAHVSMCIPQESVTKVVMERWAGGRTDEEGGGGYTWLP